jgi:cytochrome P450
VVGSRLALCLWATYSFRVPLNGLNTKVAPADGVRINSVWIPGGTQVAHAHHSMMRRSDIFGDDAALFRPERWLGGDTELLRQRERVWEFSFSHGRFVCLGRPIALMELNKVFVEVSYRAFVRGL